MNNGFTLPKTCKIEHVAETRNTCYTLMGIQVNVERKSLITTDGKIALELPIPDINGEMTVVVPAETFKALRKRSPGRGDCRKLHCDGTHATVKGHGSEERFAVLEGPFPDVVSVLDAVPDAGNADVVLGINAALLARLAEGMGTDKVVLRIRTTNRHAKSAISVTPLDRKEAPVPDARGVILPIAVKP